LRRFGFQPSVFKKTADGRSKGVDITLARDLLAHAYLDNYDVAVVVANDGDYLPLVEEAQRRGRIIIVAAFDCKMSPELRLTADYFYDLRPRFVSFWREVVGGEAFTSFIEDNQ